MTPFIDPKELEELAHKYRIGTISEEEKERFDTWFASNTDISEISDPQRATKEQHEALLYAKIKANIKLDEAPKQVRWIGFRRIGYAAALFIVLGIGAWYFYAQSGDGSFGQSVVAQLDTTDIGPARNTATLTLTNGKTILLDEMTNGTTLRQGGLEITKSNDGILSYKALPTDATSAISRYNELRTAKGEQFQLILADGTKVWLNAATSLRFPQQFNTKQQRQVFLEGEAYFEVAKNKGQRFQVICADQSVEVLGTQFNVNSYPDEASMKTTLLEGSVKINGNTLLKPNQQASSSAQNINVKTVNATDMIDWKNGTFTFKNENIVAVMRKVARWYDVDVSFYSEAALDQTFSGSISRAVHVSKILRVLEQSSDLKFTLKNRKITVSTK